MMTGDVLWVFALPVAVFLVGVWVLKIVLSSLMTAVKLAAAVALLVFLLSLADISVSGLLQQLT